MQSKGQVFVLTLRAVILAIILSVAAIFWMHQASLVQAPGLIYAPVYLLSVPPVPAIFCLLLLVALVPLTRRLRGGPFTKKELLFIFMVLVIAIPPVTFGVLEMLVPWISAPVYFAAPDNNYMLLADAMPQWFYPHDYEVIRTMYEGSDDGRVPWGPWLYPLGMWTLFMTLFVFTGMCLVTLFRKQWVENERLRYPLLFIPLSIVEKQAPGSRAPFFRNPLVWIAMAIVFIHHALNVAHSYNPAVMALMDRSYWASAVFTEYPWNPYGGYMGFFHRPQVIGLAYFVPLDILFSGWFFYLMQPTLIVLSNIFGITAAPGFPFRSEQVTGGYFAMVFIIFWIGRYEIAKIIRNALGRGTSAQGDTTDDSDEPLPHRVAVFGTIGGFVGLLIWSHVLHVPVAYSFVFFFLLMGVPLVYSRIRAEAGIPTMWGTPPSPLDSMMYAIGTRPLVRGPNLDKFAVLSTFAWMARGYFGPQIGYHAENEKLAEEAEINPRIMPPVIMITFVLACIVSFYFILTDYYRFGATVLYGGTTMGGYNVRCAITQWTRSSGVVELPSGALTPQVIGMVGGALLTFALVIMRWAWLKVPFHPIGYVTCASYGYCLWWSFFVTWLMKGVVHRLGGARLYRQLMPFFLGLAFGDLLAGGISWIAMKAFGPDILGGYMVQFG